MRDEEMGIVIAEVLLVIFGVITLLLVPAVSSMHGNIVIAAILISAAATSVTLYLSQEYRWRDPAERVAYYSMLFYGVVILIVCFVVVGVILVHDL